jgi:hypothetical protein
MEWQAPGAFPWQALARETSYNHNPSVRVAIGVDVIKLKVTQVWTYNAHRHCSRLKGRARYEQH